MTRPDIEAALERAERATQGPWKQLDALGTWIDAPSGCGPSCDKGELHVADVRGWGHLTGKGHGAHGMKPEDAMAIQKANGAFIAASRTDLPAIARYALELEAERERLREALEKAAVYLDELGENMSRNDVDMVLDDCRDPQLIAKELRAAPSQEKEG